MAGKTYETGARKFFFFKFLVIGFSLLFYSLSIANTEVTSVYPRPDATAILKRYKNFGITVGGSGHEGGECIQQTNDGGFIVAGWTNSFSVGSYDVFVVKFDRSFNIEWQKTFGGKGYDVARSVKQTKDGGYIIAGFSDSFREGHSYDVYVIRLDKSGNTVWEKVFGSENDDRAYAVDLYQDGYVIAGFTFKRGNGDMYVIKLDKNGKVEWEKTFGGNDNDGAYGIIKTKDDGFLITGDTWSFGNGGRDAYVIKLDKHGQVEWEKTFGGDHHDWAYSAKQTSDGGYIIAAHSKSFTDTGWDFYAIKLDKKGRLEWQRVTGTFQNDYAYSVEIDGDGNYILAGFNDSNAYIVKLDKNGNILWKKEFGETERWETCVYITLAYYDKYVCSGLTNSLGAGGSDIYLFMIDSNGKLLN